MPTVHKVREMLDEWLVRIGAFFGSSAGRHLKFTDSVELEMERRRYCQNRGFRA